MLGRVGECECECEYRKGFWVKKLGNSKDWGEGEGERGEGGWWCAPNIYSEDEGWDGERGWGMG